MTKGVRNIKNDTKPIFSYLGFGIFFATLLIHLIYKFIKITDVGVGMLLSLLNALLLVFTLLWSVMGIIEFSLLMKSHTIIRNSFRNNEIHNFEYKIKLRRQKIYLSVNVGYLIIIICQFGYVIKNWDEVNI
ncbi:hypothetical protein D7Z26_10380 [Cohnella endophytica]|uniref:Uncharacterized protein n=1 Tax=Cohnella endophytica TaxID=2419778 RepID=A0A494XYF5_9BACL|nr:hypothetical protein D7Z26_10265 [Cohnella endophytica]RKP55580.1 hypothetical protein D7Z26_10380 [Cohnella endophytica]